MNTKYMVCVDDSETILEVLTELISFHFSNDFKFITFHDPQQALEELRSFSTKEKRVIAFLSDYNMPSISGTDFLYYTRKIYPNAYNVLMTGSFNTKIFEENSHKNSINRFLSKPVPAHELIQTIKDALLIDQQQRKIEELTETMISSLSNAYYINSFSAGLQATRVSEFSRILAHDAGLSQSIVDKIALYSILYDIGKMGLPWAIQTKRELFSFEEFEIMKSHVLLGIEILNRKSIDPVLKNIILYHHERWNGKGYLQGLRGNEIPIEARIVAIADVYDALISNRPYRPGISCEEACLALYKESGNLFDPDLTECFLDNHKKHLWTKNKLVKDQYPASEINPNR